MPTEDLQRQPDGIPHAVIGLTALFCVVFAMFLFTILSKGTSSSISTILLGVVALPSVAALLRKAARDRDHDHPSI